MCVNHKRDVTNTRKLKMINLIIKHLPTPVLNFALIWTLSLDTNESKMWFFFFFTFFKNVNEHGFISKYNYYTLKLSFITYFSFLNYISISFFFKIPELSIDPKTFKISTDCRLPTPELWSIQNLKNIQDTYIMILLLKYSIILDNNN